jgi:phosphate transport system substrate-binding protein
MDHPSVCPLLKYYRCLLMLKSKFATSSFRRLLLLTLAAPTTFALTLSLETDRRLWAQTPAPLEGVEIPVTLPDGTTLNINSSEAMRQVNEALQSRFSEQYDGTAVDVNYQSADDAIQALLAGETDLAAVGRGLTETEAEAGLQQVPLFRHKIAIITGPENPFDGSITVEQFAQIFRGEITNWSALGGPDVPIILVDRPATSDTRQAFRNYPVFQAAPFEATADALTLDTDSTDAVIAELGSASIGYAIAEQVLDNPAVKIVPMHETLPGDPRYPFSQPLAYVYQGDNASPEALAYLGYATNPENELVIEEARAATAVPEPVATEDPVVEEAPVVEEEVVEETELATGRTRGVPWWPWLLALPVLGALLWWLLKDRAPVAAPIVTEPDRRVILTPRDCRDAYAYWELPQSEVDALKRQDCSLALRLHDVTDIVDVDQHPPHSMKQFDCENVARGDRHLPIAFDDRDYLVELGYLDKQDDWHALARSAQVRVPACPSAVPKRATGIGAAASAAGLAAAGAAVAKPRPVAPPPAVAPTPAEPARIILTPRDCRHAYAYWEIPSTQVADLTTAKRPLRLRLYDVTELLGTTSAGHNSLQEFDCPLSSPGDLHIPIPVDNRDYVMELGYVRANQQWQVLAKSDSIRVPACIDAPVQPGDGTAVGAAAAAAAGQAHRPNLSVPGNIQNTVAGVADKATDAAGAVGKTATGLAGAALAGGAAMAAGTGAAARSLFDQGKEKLGQVAGSGTGVRSDLGAESRIILVPRGGDAAYAYWEVAPVHRQEIKRQGGNTMALRIHDATNLELDYQPPHSTEEYILPEADQDKHVAIPTPDRDYVAELGYFTNDGQWLKLLRSLHVRVG